MSALTDIFLAIGIIANAIGIVLVSRSVTNLARSLSEHRDTHAGRL